MFLLLLHEEAPTTHVKTHTFLRFLRHKIVYLQIKLEFKIDRDNDKYKAKR